MHKIPENIPAEDPDLNWEPSTELSEKLKDIARQAVEDDLRDSNLLWDALEIAEETKRTDE